MNISEAENEATEFKSKTPPFFGIREYSAFLPTCLGLIKPELLVLFKS
jgi:hypothetical protein